MGGDYTEVRAPVGGGYTEVRARWVATTRRLGPGGWRLHGG